MARTARVVASGYPHQVVQRGNRRMKTFFGDEDYEAYLSLPAGGSPLPPCSFQDVDVFFAADVFEPFRPD